MASQFAKRKLLDIAQGRKKTEEELRAERFVPADEEIVAENVLAKAEQKLKAERGVANNTKVTNTAKSANAVMTDTYLKDRETVNSRNKQLSQVAYENYLYKQTKGKDTPSARQIAEQGAYAFMPDAKEQEYASRISALKNNNAANSAMTRMMQTEEENPGIKSTTQKLYDLLNERKQVVYPTSDAGYLRDMATQYGDKAATYDTSTEKGAMLAGKAQEVADEYNRQAGIVENPKEALEEVNAQIAQLENAQKVGTYWQRGTGKNQMTAKLDSLYKQRDLLAAATSGEETFERRNLMAFAGIPQSTLEGQTNEDVIKNMSQRDMNALSVTGLPEGMELKDYDPATIARDVNLDPKDYEIYRNLVDTNQMDKAEAFIEAMQSSINRNQQEAGLSMVEGMAKSGIVGGTAANVLGTGAQLFTPIAGAKSIVRNLQGKTMDAYDPVFYPGRLNATVMQASKEAIEDKIDSEFWEKAATGAYDVVKSTVDNAARALAQSYMGMGALGRTAAMGLSAYGDAAMGAAEKAGSVEQQVMLGGINAASEVMTEMMYEYLLQDTLDSMGQGTWGKVISAVVSAIFSDGLGEATNTMITTSAEEYIMREKGNVTKMAEQKVVSGEATTMDEARTMAWKDVFKGALYDGIVGALSAGAMQGGTAAVSAMQNRSTKAKLEELAKETTTEEVQAQQVAEQQPETQEQQEETLETIANTMTANEKPASQVTVRTAQEVAAERANEAQPVKVQEDKKAPKKVRQDAPEVVATDDGYAISKGGQNVNMDELDADDADARMLNSAPNMSAEAATDMLGSYDAKSNVTAEDYAKGYKQAYNDGLQGRELKKVKTLYAEDLTDEQIQRAYEMGVKARETEQANILRKTELYAAQAGMKVRQAAGTAGVSAESITRRLTDREKITMQLLDRVGKRFDLQFRIYDTLDEGKSNATYIEGTNVINVALDAQKGALTRAASHEAYHYVEQFAKDEADKLKAFVLDKLRNTEGYDLDARIRQKAEQYKAAGIDNFDAESEIVADSMLDIIGTEENIRQMAQENPTLLGKVRDAVQRISNFLQEQLEALSLINKEADALYGNKEYMDEIVRRMNKALANAKENRQAQQRVSQTAAMDTDVQAYLKDLSTAKDAQERANLLESLTNQVYLRTQMDMIQKTGDYEGGMQPFKDALRDFAQGKGNLNALLKKAGLDAATNEQDTAVMAWITRERERVGEPTVSNAVYGKNGDLIAEVIDGAAVKYSLQSWDVEEQEKVYNVLIKNGYADHEIKRWMAQVNSIAAIIAADRVNLDYESHDNHTMFKKNQEYKYTLDASTLCAKRQLYQGIFDAIQHEMPNTVLMPDDLIRLKKLMDEMGMDSPCAICYVESRRRNLDKFAGEWLSSYDGKYKPRLDEVTTSDGLEKLRVEHPDTYKHFVDAMNKIGTNNPKVVQLRTAYRGEIKKLRPNTIQYLIRIGGLRVQSFSDFEVVHMMDMMQAVIDMAAKHLTAQAYTKVPEFAWVFGNTNMKINLSLIAKGTGIDENGNLIFDDKEGMPFAEAMKLRNEYGKNVGTIIVGISDEHILKCMQDNRIDFIIPFHKSGRSQENMEMMGIGHYQNYTAEQSERYVESGRKVGAKKALYPRDYWERTFSGKQNAEKYLRLCHENGLIPKFPRFLDKNEDGSYSLKKDGSTDGYWKLLIDFKMYDNEGNYAEQVEVRPEFNMERAKVILENYKSATGNANVLPVNTEVVERFVEDFKERHPREVYSLKDEEMVNILAEITTDEEVRDAGKLINRLDEMRRAQGVTKGAWSGKTSELSKKILQDTSSRMGQAALTKQINALYRAMDEGDVTPRQLMEYAYDVAAKVAEGASVAQDMDEGVKDARAYIRNTTIYLNEDMQSEIRAKYGNLQAFMRNYFGRARFTTDSRKTSLEDMWDELCDMAPGYFKRDAVASEMPEALETFLEATGKVARDYFGANEDQLKQDVAMRLFWEYYRMPGTYGDLLDKQKEMVTQLHDTWEGLRDTFEQRVREKVENYKDREERLRQRNMLEKSVNAMSKRLLKPTKQQHIPEEMRGAVASMLELVNTSGNKQGQEKRTKAYEALQRAIKELRETDVGYAYVDPDLEVYLKELREKSAGKSIMGMSLQELKDMNKVVTGIRHACVVADQLITEGHKGSVTVLADDAKVQLDRMKDRKVRGDLANMVSSVGKYAFEDAPRFFRDLARYTGKAGENLWNIVRHGGLDKQITLLKEADDKMAEIRSRYKGYEKWMSRNSESKSFVTDSGTIELTDGQIMALYLLNKREQARNHIYGVKGEDGGIAQKRVQTKHGAQESVRPHKVTEDQVNRIIGTLTKEQKAFADEMGALLSGWCADLGNEVSMNMYGYKKFTEKNYFPIEVWGGRKDATSGEAQQNQLYLIMNKGFTKELTDKAQAPLVIPDMFDAVTEHVNGMIVYNAWTAPVTDMIKFINYKFRDDSMTMDQDGNEVFAPGQNIIGTVKEDISRVMGNGAETWYVQLIKDINGLAKNKTEKAVSGFVNKLTRNFKATAVGYNIGTMLKQPTSVIRAFDVIPPMYFAGKLAMPNKERQAIMEKYAPIVTWKGYGNYTMDTGKSIERILFPESSTKMEKFNEWGMAGAGFMDTVTWHNIWMAAERMAAKQNPNLQRGTDAFYKKTAEIFNQCIDQTQTVDSILHRTQLMRQDTAWIKSVTTFMGEPMKSYNMLLDAVNAWKTQSTKERAMKVSKEAGIFAANAVTAAFVSSMISALRNWDDEEPFWDQVWGKMFGEYDEDMTTWEKIKEAIFGGNLAGELNILNYIPVARDIMETFAGYDVERVDMSLFADVRDAVEALKNEKTATPEKIMDLVGALGNFLGIPVNNILTECKRIWNYGNRQLEAFGVDTLDSQYAFLRAQKRIGASANMTDYANLMLKAEEAGRDDLVAEIRQDMMAAGTEGTDIDSKMYKLQVEDLTGMKASKVSYEKTYAALGAAMKAGDKELQMALERELKRAGRTDEQIENGLIAWLKEDERVISAAEKAVQGDTTEKVQLVKTLRDEGFSDAVAKKAINQLQNKMVTDAKAGTGTQEEKTSEPKYEALFTSYDLQTAIESGSDVGDIMADLRKQGKSDTSIKSSLTSSIKPIYIALMRGTASDRAKAKQIKERLLKLDLENKYTEKAIDGWLE